GGRGGREAPGERAGEVSGRAERGERGRERRRAAAPPRALLRGGRRVAKRGEARAASRTRGALATLRPVVRADGADDDRLTRRADGVYDLPLSCELQFPDWPWR